MTTTHPESSQDKLILSRFVSEERRNYVIGIGLLLVVVFLWTSSNFLTQVCKLIEIVTLKQANISYTRAYMTKDTKNHSCMMSLSCARLSAHMSPQDHLSEHQHICIVSITFLYPKVHKEGLQKLCNATRQVSKCPHSKGSFDLFQGRGRVPTVSK